MPELLIATLNPGKFEEICHYLNSRYPSLDLRSLADVGGAPSVIEDGGTFEENAGKKAVQIAQFTGSAALADDSGLEVESLAGRPGVFSARFAGPRATDAENTAKLLEELRGVPMGQRQAAFRCVMVAAMPKGASILAKGEVRGEILAKPRGRGGFGYDPVFFLPELRRSMAELTLPEKNRLSHRARALAGIADQLTSLFPELIEKGS